MSDPKRATLITVGAPKSAKQNVTKTVRLTINLDESNESKYPELNYKELVITEEVSYNRKSYQFTQPCCFLSSWKWKLANKTRKSQII